MRHITCVICGADQSSMAFSYDPWCSDACHKEAARRLTVDQKHLVAAVYWLAVDAVLHRYRKLKKLTSVHYLEFIGVIRKVNQYAQHPSRPEYADYIEDLRRHSPEPADWSRRVMLLSQTEWPVSVRELRRARPAV